MTAKKRMSTDEDSLFDGGVSGQANLVTDAPAQSAATDPP
jgi:hypothetical protein